MIGAINNYLYLWYRTQIWNIMDDFNTVYALLVLVMLFILLSRLDNRFGKIEKELNEIKKRMEDYLKVQQNSVAEASKPKEEISEKETKDIPVKRQSMLR